MSELGSCFPSAQDLLQSYLEKAWAGVPCVVCLPSSSSPEDMEKYYKEVQPLFGVHTSNARMAACTIFPCGNLAEAKKLRGRKKDSCSRVWDGKELLGK